MDAHLPRQRIHEPWSETKLHTYATRLLGHLQEGLVVYHLRFLPEESLDAMVAVLRRLAQEQGVRLVIKRDIADGRLRYRLRRRREEE